MDVPRLLGLVLAALALPRLALAQSDSAWWAVVTSDDVYVRSAPSVESSYPFLQVRTGDVVRVAEESAGWARVLMQGPTFKDAYGFVRADRRVTLAPDKRTAEVTARTDVFAPNLSARSSPDSSWKSIARIDPGRTVVVLESIEGQRDTVYKVPMPPHAEGWINLAFLKRATDADLAKAGVTASDRAPANTPGQTPAQAPTGATSPAAPGAGTPGAGATAPNAGTQPTGTEGTGASPGAGANGIGAASTSPPGAGAPGAAPAEGGTTPITMEPGAVVEVDERATVIEETIDRIQLSDLEARFKVLLMEETETAEVGPLREAYVAFAMQDSVSAANRDFALARAEQLLLRTEVQQRLQRLRRLRNRTDVELEGVRAIVVAAENRQAYAAIGRLNASSVFNGDRLPLLFRVQDPAGGQTVAYVAPVEGIELFPLLGQLVGVVGTPRYDSALRVNVVTPVRVDILTRAGS